MLLKFDDLVEQAKTDLNLTRDNLVEQSSNTSIHALFYAGQRKGYMDLKNKETQRLNRAKRLLWQYYSGKANASVLKEIGKEKPFQIQFSNKGDIDTFIMSDSIYQEIEQKISSLDTTIKFLDEVIGAIRFRTQVVRNIIQEKQFLGG